MLKIKSIKANCGDSFLIEDLSECKTLLIDCGFKLTYQFEIKHLISKVDYLILTHSDQDHINGAIPLIYDSPEKVNVGEVFINIPSSYGVHLETGDISIHQAITLEKLLIDQGVSYRGLVAGQIVQLSKELSLEVISPTKTDLEYFIGKYKDVQEGYEPDFISITNEFNRLSELAKQGDKYKNKKSDFTNSVSIAFILKYKNYKFLFLGDSHPTVITEYLESKGFSSDNKYVFDYIKLSHHGSITSISNKFISMISCSNYIVSTNGGKSNSCHPNRETLAKIVVKVDRNGSDKVRFYFNYPIEEIESRNGKLLTNEEINRFNVEMIENDEFVLK